MFRKNSSLLLDLNSVSVVEQGEEGEEGEEEEREGEHKHQGRIFITYQAYSFLCIYFLTDKITLSILIFKAFNLLDCHKNFGY
jgi:hypothetical protein